jgi:hypothetical protein
MDGEREREGEAQYFRFDRISVVRSELTTVTIFLARGNTCLLNLIWISIDAVCCLLLFAVRLALPKE